MRTLEQKIADAGPNDQRIDPHVLTEARRDLQEKGKISTIDKLWYFSTDSDQNFVHNRILEQKSIHEAITESNFVKRLGQTLEISVYRALLQKQNHNFLGQFLEIDTKPDNELYKKYDPPIALNGRLITNGGPLDFLLIHASNITAGIEVKNIREWLYPNTDDVKSTLLKCCQLDVVPIIIARRIPFVTFRLLNPCGVILHQTYNQLYPSSESNLADRVKDKRLLGYHDVRLGNAPDKRLLRFITENVPKVLPNSRISFNEHKDLLYDYASGAINYEIFAARVRRRQSGLPHDSDLPDDFMPYDL